MGRHAAQNHKMVVYSHGCPHPGHDRIKNRNRQTRGGEHGRHPIASETRETSQYPEGHQRLASAYLAAGKTEQALQHYAQAFQLFPSEENEKLLIAIDKRIKQGNPQPDGAANGSRPFYPFR